MSKIFWTLDRPPTLREYPALLLRLLTAGTVLGLLFSFFPLSEAFQQSPLKLLYSAYVGAAFFVSFSVFCGLPWTYLRPLVAKYPPLPRRILVAILGSFNAMLAFAVAVGIIGLVPDIQFWGRRYFGVSLAIEGVIGAILALGIGTFKAMQRQIRGAEAALLEKEMRAHALGEAAARAQSFALQAQINPHFFFNTLNTLSALVPINPDAAQEVIGRLAEMFRYTLACSRAEEVTLTQELAFVENYLQLERARFSDRLVVTLPEGDFSDITLPGLSLQPLVENAIRHGIAKRLDGGEVQVSVHRNGAQCSVDVSNPAEVSDLTAFFRPGHALANVRDRLALYAGGSATVRVGVHEPGHVRVSLIVPLEHRS